MDKRFKSGRHVVSNLEYHIIWCSKYRKPLIVGKVEERLKQILLEKAKEEGWSISSIKIAPDSVCISIKATPNDSPITIASRLKGHTSSKLRDEFPDLKKKLPSLWTRSFFVESIGKSSDENIKNYIIKQKTV